MNRRVSLFVLLFSLLAGTFVAETLWFALGSGAGYGDKRDVVALTGLPDLAVATEARFLRFRSLADVYSPFNEGPELLDYFPASFTYAPSGVERLVPSRIEAPR
jgi:hypothetical protein